MSSSQDYFHFYHDTAHSEKRYVVACVKTYDNTGTHISLKRFKKENADNEFRFNQKLTLSMQELEQVGENIDAIRVEPGCNFFLPELLCSFANFERVILLTLSKFAIEQSSSGKRKLQPGSSLETNGQSRSCRFKKSKKNSQRVIKRFK